MEDDKTPKVFISYSWSSDELVLDLAKRLVAHGVDVVLDKWDLKEGNDKYEFMERCVNDSEITKVLIICDKIYAQKANDRTGGVGDETVIISSEIYGNARQEKFIPIIAERDEEGKEYVPIYIKTRIYIDLSDPAKYEEEYEKLLRNIYEKPQFTMPRELEWKDGKILQHPLKEMKDLRKNAFTCELEAFTKWAPADCCFELRLDVEEAKNLELKLREDVTISWKDGLFTLSMGESGRGRKQRFAKVEELSDITIFSDTSAIEIFINNGETVLTTRVYSEHLEQKVELVSREVKGSVHGYELGSFEVEYKK